MHAPVKAIVAFLSAISMLQTFALSAQNQIEASAPDTCIWVSVTDKLSRVVPGLSKEHFRIYDNNRRQTINRLSMDSSVPVCLGIIWDVSRSMNVQAGFESMPLTIMRLADSRRVEDEYFLVTFAGSIQIHNVTSKMPPVDLLQEKDHRKTALLDAIFAGLIRSNQSRLSKKALLIITDAEDNSSRHSTSEVRNLAKASDVQIFIVYSSDGIGRSFSDMNPIPNLAEVAGGEVFYPSSFREIGHYMNLAVEHLRYQYQLCYAPSNGKQRATRHSIRIKLEAPGNPSGLTTHTRQEIHAPPK